MKLVYGDDGISAYKDKAVKVSGQILKLSLDSKNNMYLAQIKQYNVTTYLELDKRPWSDKILDKEWETISALCQSWHVITDISSFGLINDFKFVAWNCKPF